jgi:hypothetical protein
MGLPADLEPIKSRDSHPGGTALPQPFSDDKEKGAFQNWLHDAPAWPVARGLTVEFFRTISRKRGSAFNRPLKGHKFVVDIDSIFLEGSRISKASRTWRMASSCIPAAEAAMASWVGCT